MPGAPDVMLIKYLQIKSLLLVVLEHAKHGFYDALFWQNKF